MKTTLYNNYLKILEGAELRWGSTGTNPSVGAAILHASGVLLAEGYHRGSGFPHAEVEALTTYQKIRALHPEDPAYQAAIALVTLEPCNHFGRTPPCTHALLAAGIRQVFFGTKDLNPQVSGGGQAYLQQQGCQAEWLFETPQSGVDEQKPPLTSGEQKPSLTSDFHKHLSERSQQLVRPFFHWSQTGRPWVVLKQAFRKIAPDRWSQLPEPGQKTFTQLESLRRVHLLRRRSQAILTGSGTWLTDQPEFTIRHVPDLFPPTQKRLLLLLDRRRRVPEASLKAAEPRGFEVLRFMGDLPAALAELGRRGVHQVLIEAGPQVSQAFLEQKLWDERIEIFHHGLDQPDSWVETLRQTGQN